MALLLTVLLIIIGFQTALIGLLAGKNFGKLMVRVSPDPTRR